MTHEYIYRFDSEKYEESCDDPLSLGMKQVFGTVIEWCSYAYLKGLANEPFSIPSFLPIRKWLSEPKVLPCTSCGEVIIVEAYLDGNCIHAKCDNCGAKIVISR